MSDKIMLRQLLATSDADAAKVLGAELLHGAELVRLKAMSAKRVLVMMQLRAEGSRFPVDLRALLAAVETAPEQRLDPFYVFGSSHDGQVVVDLVSETVVLCWALPIDREMVDAGNDASR